MRLSFFIAATVAASQAYGGHVALFKQGNCSPSSQDGGGSVVEITAENEIWCSPIEGVFTAAASYYNTGLPCEFRLYNNRNCNLNTLSHTIRTDNPTGHCLRATGPAHRYLAMDALCGESFPRRSVKKDASWNETEAETAVDVSDDMSKRALDWSHITNFVGQRFARLRANRRVMDDYAETHHVLTRDYMAVPVAVLTPAAARSLADIFIDTYRDRRTTDETIFYQVGRHTLSLNLTGLIVAGAGGIRDRVMVGPMARDLGNQRLQQMIMALFETMRHNDQHVGYAEYKFEQGAQPSFSINVMVT
ncbi:hypothetical protein G7Z17_g13477 [Cylindrodendrum hubeiense]|uniref:Uncharacterized protein n=1 Tax=Cylindrodendrum hubeiense TaxID=595255 RepID=A0A9P5L877_9HYPO|nr:hypothetical protein G7Z17_g13477 [Cylindrodendrum hubeiense]